MIVVKSSIVVKNPIFVKKLNFYENQIFLKNPIYLIILNKKNLVIINIVYHHQINWIFRSRLRALLYSPIEMTINFSIFGPIFPTRTRVWGGRWSHTWENSRFSFLGASLTWKWLKLQTKMTNITHIL